MGKKKLYSMDAIQVFSLGNEAVVRGLVEAGVQVCASYPGTPTSEILEVLANFNSKFPELKMYTEWSSNEAVALELVIAAAQTGLRSAFSCKHVGLNVAMDAFMTMPYSGVEGGLVLVVGDDPSLHSSQNEQDTRYFGKAASVPILEPSTPKEAYEFAKLSFELSEQFKMPVILRITTRIAHARQTVHFNKILPQPRIPEFKSDVKRLVNVPAFAKSNHINLIERFQQLKESSETLKFNEIVGELPAENGVITSGVSYTYVREALSILGLNDVAILKLGLSFPIPENIVVKFMKSVNHVLVVEEVEPILETELRALAQYHRLGTKIYGKIEGYTPNFGELNTKIVTLAIQDFLELEHMKFDEPESTIMKDKELLFNRPPTLCAGCPHRASFLILKKALGKDHKNAIYANDIGCYALGVVSPANVADTLLCMGASISMGSGFAHSGLDRPVVSIIGDSTFWHSGLPGLANAVYNNANIIIYVVDNLTTAMTGMQENPSTDHVFVVPETAKKLSIERVAKAMNIPTIVVDPWQMEDAVNKIKNHLQHYKEGPRLIISRRECVTKTIRSIKEIQPFTIIPDKCVGCRICIDQLGCPAISLDPSTLEDKHPKPIIDPKLCTACSLCAEVCPVDAISGEILDSPLNVYGGLK
jgi:indolepyruvate ferredoxin oxidoreductase alpha subunit